MSEQMEFWIAERQVRLDGEIFWHATGGLYISAEAAVIATQRHMDETCRVRRFVDAAEIEALRAERDEWRNALQGLTPTGSDFLTPSECSNWLRDRLNYPRQIIALRARVEEQDAELQFFRATFPRAASNYAKAAALRGE